MILILIITILIKPTFLLNHILDMDSLGEQEAHISKKYRKEKTGLVCVKVSCRDTSEELKILTIEYLKKSSRLNTVKSGQIRLEISMPTTLGTIYRP